ncbi:MAG: autotransporter-associated beta strand repeat-containing protein [Kiritimatiellia bacterium]
MKVEISVVLAASAILGSPLAQADALSWMSEPADAEWNTTSLNWGEGAAWVNGCATAVFGESSWKTIALGEDITFTNLVVEADGYRFTGPGSFVLSTDLPESTNERKTDFFVGEGLQATVDATITNPLPAAPFVKQGTGTLTLSGTTTVARIHVNAGTLQLVSNVVATSKLRMSTAQSVANLHVDGATIIGSKLNDSDNGRLIGDVGVRFTSATLGTGGLIIRQVGGDMAISQPFATAPGIETDGGIVKWGPFLLIAEDQECTFNGGLVVMEGQVRVKGPHALGTGPVTLAVEGSPFFAEADVRVPNKVIFAKPETWVGSTGSALYNLTLTSIGTGAANTEHAVYLGRANGAFSRAALSLTQTNSEPVSVIKLRGGLDFEIDGGVIAARSDAASPFFDCSSLAVTSAPVAKVTHNGFTFDAAAGANTELGLTLQLADAYMTTNYPPAEGAFANPSFESGFDGWTWGKTSETAEDVSNPQANSSGFTTAADWKTTDGEKYAVLRRENYMTGSFTVPSNGLWRVSFKMSCRSQDEYQGHLIPVTVLVDGGEALAIGAREKHAFKVFSTQPVELAAGSHSIRIETGSGEVKWDSLLFDAFGVEAVEEVRIPMAPVTKLGEGRLTITNLVTDGRVDVSGGTLALENYSLVGATVPVAANARLELYGGTLAQAAVTVAANGTLGIGSARNLILNGDFESDWLDPTLGGGTYSQVSSLTGGWTFDRFNGQSSLSGVQQNGGTMSANWYATPSGNMTAFIRSSTQMKCTIRIPADGTYRLSFLHCARNYSNSYNLPIYVKIDGETNLTVAARTAYYDYTRETTDLELSAGSHELALEVGGDTRSGALILVDDIRLQCVDAADQTIVDSRIDLATGSIVDLQNIGPLTLAGGVFVDGVKFTGSRTRLAQRGVVVTGEGQIQVGPPDGTILLFR